MLELHRDGTPVIRHIEDLFQPEVTKRVRMIGLVGDPNKGKTNVINHIINIFQTRAKDTQIAVFGIARHIPNILHIHTIEELERLRNAVVFIDEWADLVDVGNRRQMREFERSIRTIFHPQKNNIVILCGMARNFNGKISGMLNCVIFKETTLIDIVQRSVLANIMSEYNNGFRVTKGKVLSMDDNVALVHIVGGHFDEVEIPYFEEGDTKLQNPPIVKWDETVAQTGAQSCVQTDAQTAVRKQKKG
jgi:hypothetical protein